VIPLVAEKGSAILRILLQHCVGSAGGSSQGGTGTNLPTIIRSVFDFYHVIILEGSSAPELGGLFNTLTLILKALKNDGFNSPGKNSHLDLIKVIPMFIQYFVLLAIEN